MSEDMVIQGMDAVNKLLTVETKPKEVIQGTSNINNPNMGFSSMNNDSPVIYINNNYMSQDINAEVGTIMNRQGFGVSQPFRRE
jgi:hypothetical protein